MQEYERRFLVWLDNMEYAHTHNEKQSSFKVGPQLVFGNITLPLATSLRACCPLYPRHTPPSLSRWWARGDIMGRNLLTRWVFSVQLGLTTFADMSLEEYKTHALGYRCEWRYFVA